MTDLRNTIAHILEHKQHLADANEATIQQYVVLPILRTLGWNDTNLASMEIIPDLINKEGWGLNSAKFSQMLCGFRLTDKGVIGNIKRVFGILPEGLFPVDRPVGKDGELIKRNPKASMLPRLFVLIDEAEAKQLEHEHDGCEFCAISEGQKVDYVYYDIPEDMSQLLPVLEFAYKKHTGN